MTPRDYNGLFELSHVAMHRSWFPDVCCTLTLKRLYSVCWISHIRTQPFKAGQKQALLIENVQPDQEKSIYVFGIRQTVYRKLFEFF